MASTVLGKRTRSAAKADAHAAAATAAARDALPAPSTRSKRRAPFVILDEGDNSNPFVTPSKRTRRNGAAAAVDSPASPRSRDTRPAAATPTTHRLHSARIPLSPTKANAPIKPCAPSTDKSTDKSAVTPSTPRHRDALAAKVAVTPRHRLAGRGRPSTPRTPHTSATFRQSASTVFNDARQLFIRGSAPPGALFGREEERRELKTFISTRTATNKPGCIYVSGPPGTGKSAFINHVCHEISTTIPVKTAHVNCMSVKNATDLYRTLLQELVQISSIEEGKEMEALECLFMQRKASYLVTLDEVDHLLELDMDLLYSIFEWSLEKSSSLVLVGIANALDFTDRFLPRLKTRGLQPRLLPFLPYTAAQISSVLTSKLKSLVSDDEDYVPFIHPTAILFLSKKVASQTGDLRKAFDICRRAIDLIEADTLEQHARTIDELTPAPTPSPSKTPLVENMNLSSPTIRSPAFSKANETLGASLPQLTAKSAPRVTVALIARVTAAVFNNGTTQRLQALNLQQKIVLCSLSAMERKKRTVATDNVLAASSLVQSTAPSAQELFEAYTVLCKRKKKLHPLTSTEFCDILGSLENLSLITTTDVQAGALVAAGTPSRKCRGGFGGFVLEDRRIVGSVDAKELTEALACPASDILKGIIAGDGVF